MKRCKGLCLTIAISQGKVGEELGDCSSRRKYCAVCERYFGLCSEVTRCPCCSNAPFNPFFSYAFTIMHNQKNVIPYSDQNAIVLTSSQQSNMLTTPRCKHPIQSYPNVQVRLSFPETRSMNGTHHSMYFINDR
jgi:hypothetical protein